MSNITALRQTSDVTDLPAIVDELAQIATDIAVLTAKSDNLKAKLLQSGLDEVCGSTLRALCIRPVDGVSVSWKALAESFQPSASEIASFSTTKIGTPYIKLVGYNARRAA